MIARLSLLIWLCAIAAAEAEDGPMRMEPTPTETAAVENCVARRTTSSDRRACIGVVAARCRDTQDGATTLGSTACSSREAMIWDRLLNRTYRDALSDFDADGKAYLKATQTTWIRFRDQACEWPDKVFAGGSIARPLSAECSLNQTALRALDPLELREALKER